MAVDTADIFGQAFALKAIPVTFLVDEVGIIRLQGGGPSPEFLREVERVLGEPLASVRGKLRPLPAARPPGELEERAAERPDDWQAHLALAQHYDAQGRGAESLKHCETAARIEPGEAAVFFTWGLILLNQKEKDAALVKLRQARDLAPDNWRIRKQIWALEHPDRFYTKDSPDFRWQKEQFAREQP